MVNNENTRKAVAARIVELIEARGSTKQHIADAAGISRHTLARSLSGGRDFGLNELEAIASSLGTTPSDLLPESWSKSVVA